MGSVDSSTGASVEFSFVDNGSADLEVDEISTGGSLEPVATLAPGVSYQAGTNVGAYWVIENSGGGCLAVFDINGAGSVTAS